MFQWFRRLIQQREIRRRRKEMYPQGSQWRQISPGMFVNRIDGIERYLAMRKRRESARYMAELRKSMQE